MRPLRADELELRVGTVGKKGVSLLLYKNARVDMVVLDETYPGKWQRDHKEIKGNLYCGIGIYDEGLDEWIWRWDCGTEPYTEKEKGEASDSFKRAGFNWGIGRELYTAPSIFLPVATVQEGNRYKMANPYDLNGMYVREIETDELDGKRIITRLSIWQNAQGRDSEIWKWERKGR